MNGFDLDGLLDMIVERVADRVVSRIEQRSAERAQPEMITMREFGRRHSVSENTVRNMIRDGRLDAVKIGAAVRIRADAAVGKPAPRAPNVIDTPRERAAKILRGQAQ